MRKSTDNITLSTQLGYSTNNVWYYTLMGDLNTQFAKGYNYPDKTHYISNFFAPAYSNISVGMEYRPKSNYSVYLSPASTKMTFVEDDYLSELGGRSGRSLQNGMGSLPESSCGINRDGKRELDYYS
jgi:hypothetical protein